jgi:Transglutaminase-like superfamily
MPLTKQRTPSATLRRACHRATRLFMIALLFTVTVGAAPAQPAWQKLPQIHDWFGVYLQGQKVGYLESVREKRDADLHTRQRMVARVAGMGQQVQVEVLSDGTYDATTGKLKKFSFAQTSPTGAVEVHGVSRDGKIEVTFKAGGESRVLPSQKDESIVDHVAGELLAADPKAKPGAKVETSAFDPSLQKVTHTTFTLAKLEKHMLDGVEVNVRQVTSKITELGVEEEGIYTPEGRALEAKISGLFTIRLEDEKRAKDLSYSQDVLVAFVVPVDKPIKNPYVLGHMSVLFTGAGDYPMPTNSRQTMEKVSSGLRMNITREIFDEKSAAGLPIDPSRFAADLKPEPLLQSDAPEVRAMAKEVIGNETNAYRAAKLLLDWVYRRVEKAYVPAVSNALEVLKTRKGDCGEHAVLFVALARAAGIPARPVVGITYWPPGNGFGYHAWAEIWVGRWIAVDPTQGSMAADATHVQLAGGDLAEQARITMLIGKLKAKIESTR